MQPIRRSLFALCAIFLVAVSCRPLPPGAVPTTTAIPDRPELKVALLAANTGANSGPANRAVEGARLALDRVNETGELPIALVGFGVDTEEDPATAAQVIQDDIVADPDVVAVIGWPSTAEAPGIGTALSKAGIPFLDLSPAGDSEMTDSQWTAWKRFVADDALLATATAQVIAGTGKEPVCLAGVGDPRALVLQSGVGRDLDRKGIEQVPTSPVEIAGTDDSALIDEISKAKCEIVYWSGNGADASVLRKALDDAGSTDVGIVGGDGLRNEAYLARTGPAADGTLSVCPCADVSDTTQLPAQAFVQEYQAKFGGPPGVYSVEGWDAGEMLIGMARSGATDRSAIAQALNAEQRYDGLERTYRFAATGDLARSAREITVAIANAGQWLPYPFEAKYPAQKAGSP